MISVLHSLKSQIFFIHMFNTEYWTPSYRNSSMKWVHWVQFYLDGYFTWWWSCFSAPFISFICVIRVVRSSNFDSCILIRTIWTRGVDYLLNFVYVLCRFGRSPFLVTTGLFFPVSRVRKTKLIRAVDSPFPWLIDSFPWHTRRS